MDNHIVEGVVRNGRIELAADISWPEGTRVKIVESDEDRPRTAEEIAEVLAAMAAIEPFDLTAEEIESINKRRQERKEWEKTNFFSEREKLRKMWE